MSEPIVSQRNQIVALQGEVEALKVQMGTALRQIAALNVLTAPLRPRAAAVRRISEGNADEPTGPAVYPRGQCIYCKNVGCSMQRPLCNASKMAYARAKKSNMV